MYKLQINENGLNEYNQKMFVWVLLKDDIQVASQPTHSLGKDLCWNQFKDYAKKHNIDEFKYENTGDYYWFEIKTITRKVLKQG